MISPCISHNLHNNKYVNRSVSSCTKLIKKQSKMLQNKWCYILIFKINWFLKTFRFWAENISIWMKHEDCDAKPQIWILFGFIRLFLYRFILTCCGCFLVGVGLLHLLLSLLHVIKKKKGSPTHRLLTVSMSRHTVGTLLLQCWWNL